MVAKSVMYIIISKITTSVYIYKDEKILKVLKSYYSTENHSDRANNKI